MTRTEPEGRSGPPAPAILLEMHSAQRIAVLALLAAVSVAAAAEEPRVEITGGVDPSGQNYSWTVTNRSDTPIVSVTFPHYNADLFSPPAGWQREETHLRHVGSKPAPGICRGFVDGVEKSGILPSGSAGFSIRLNADGASKGRGVVQVRFKDGRTVSVRNVELPVAPTFFGQYGMMIALAAAFAIFVLVQVRRKKNRGGAEDSDEEAEADRPVA
ncbi:MAG: hypothetical protein AMXMBFR47_24030 [Planctomycetota bacterium]